jgi:hypothetical protein
VAAMFFRSNSLLGKVSRLNMIMFRIASLQHTYVLHIEEEEGIGIKGEVVCERLLLTVMSVHFKKTLK